MDHSSGRQSKLKRQYSNTIERSKKDLNIIESSHTNRFETEKLEDNCSIAANVNNSSFA